MGLARTLTAGAARAGALAAPARRAPHGGAAAVGLAYALALAFGLATGLADVAIVLFVRFGLHRLTHVPTQAVWMAPVAYAALFLVVALPFGVAALRRPDGRWLMALIAALALLSAFSVLLHATTLYGFARVLLAAGVAVQATRLLEPLVYRRRRLVPATVLALALATAVIGGGYNVLLAARERAALAALPQASAGAPNVLLLIWDTTRASELGLYGFPRPTTPNLDAFAREGVVFDDAIAAAPWTLPSHASLFTGRFPHELSVSWRHGLDDRYPTLAQVLARHGWATAGFVGNTAYVSRESGLDRGMAHFEGYASGPGDFVMATALGQVLANAQWLRQALGDWQVPGRKSAGRVRGDFLGWLDRRPAGHPFFAFLNFYDAHMPYLPAAPYDRRFRTVAVRRRPMEFDAWKLTPAQHVAERDAYDGSIAYMDAELGRILDGLRRRALLDNTLVIVAADHGEEFGEHRVYQHGNSVFFDALHVPLVMVWPRGLRAGERIAPAVALRDLPATIMDLLRLGPGPFPGGAFAGLGSSARAPGAAPVLSELDRNWTVPAWYPVHGGTLRSVISGQLHLIQRADGAVALFDLARDPGETTDLSRRPPFADSARALDALIRPASGAAEVSE